MATILENLQAVNARIAGAARSAGRAPDSVRLLAVSKAHSVTLLREACAAGVRAFGENYVQEALAKMDALGDSGLEWHLIGPLQSNKTRAVAERFDWVHTLEREKVAQRLSEQRPADLPPLNVLIQVNVSGEATKAGLAPEAVAPLAARVAPLPRLRLRGLMAIPEPTHDVSLQRARFREVRRSLERLNAEGFQLDTLSMGMSDDMEAAIAEGATLVRIGTAIFGPRERARSAA
jgi:PLP dependent protein